MSIEMPRLSRLELLVHELAEGAAAFLFVSSVFSLLREPDLFWLVLPALASLVLALSLTVVVRRFRPGARGLRNLEISLSALVALLGVLGVAATLAFMSSGASYRGSSPDAGGMAVVAAMAFYYPSTALLLLPFGMNASRLPTRVRRWVVLACPVLALLPIGLLVAIRLMPGQ
jgi:hypothetical protein